MIHIIAVGKKHELWVAEGIRRYEKRLKKPFNITWHLLSHSSKEGDEAREEESQRILARLSPDDYVVLLDERGKLLDSPSLSSLLLTSLRQSSRIVVVIGGAYGVTATLRSRANVVWSLSLLVFPHQLVRLIVVEQFYRAQEIAAGRPYHHA